LLRHVKIYHYIKYYTDIYIYIYTGLCFLLIAFFTLYGLFSVSCVVMGVVGNKILSVTDGGTGFGGDSSCGVDSSGGSSYVLLLFFIYLCAQYMVMREITVC